MKDAYNNVPMNYIVMKDTNNDKEKNLYKNSIILRPEYFFSQDVVESLKEKPKDASDLREV